MWQASPNGSRDLTEVDVVAVGVLDGVDAAVAALVGLDVDGLSDAGIRELLGRLQRPLGG